MNNDLYKRLAKVEASVAALNAEHMEILEKAYNNACDEGNREDAALFARKIRDILLRESDCEIVFDRFDISVPSGSSFSSWLTFLKSLGSIIQGDWAIYRQQLRDITEQEGFPFNIDFPKAPNDKNQNESEEL